MEPTLVDNLADLVEHLLEPRPTDLAMKATAGEARFLPPCHDR